MRDNSDIQIPYVPKDVCEYLRGVYSLPTVLNTVRKGTPNNDVALGYMQGVNAVLEFLEALQGQQEEHAWDS